MRSLSEWNETRIRAARREPLLAVERGHAEGGRRQTRNSRLTLWDCFGLEGTGTASNGTARLALSSTIPIIVQGSQPNIREVS